MALKDDKPRIIAALQGIPGVKAVLDAWPQTFAKLPVIIVEEADNSPAERRDDRERITRLEYYIRVFTKHAAERSAIASAVDDLLLSLHYERALVYDEGGEGVRQKTMRYYTYI